MARRKKRGTKRKSSKRRMSGFGGAGKGLTKYIMPVIAGAVGLAAGQIAANQIAKMFPTTSSAVAGGIQAGVGLLAATIFGSNPTILTGALSFAAGGALTAGKGVIPGLGALTEGDVSDIMNGIQIGATPFSVGAIQDGRGDIANDRDGEEY